MTLAEQLEQAKIRERMARWDANEQALLQGHDLPKAQLSADTLNRCDVWGKWCEARGVRKAPAKSWVVASYLVEQSANGVPAQVLVAMLEAISALHDYHNLSNPCATRVVNLALEQIVHPEIPRSWTREERAEWIKLPPPVRDAIGRRENDRDRAVRRAQTELAKLKRHSDADESAIELKETKTCLSDAGTTA
jgi:hypothetical protein